MTLQERLREDVKGCPFPNVYWLCNEAALVIDSLEAALKAMQERAETAETALDAAYKALDEMARAR